MSGAAIDNVIPRLRSVQGVNTNTSIPVSFSELGSPVNVRLLTQPTGASEAVSAAILGECTHSSANTLGALGTGHNVGILGMIDHLGGGLVNAAYGVEGRVQAQSGSFTVAASQVATLQAVGAGAGGAIGIGVQFYGTTMDDHAHVSAKYGVFMSATNAENRFDGNVNVNASGQSALQIRGKKVTANSVWLNYNLATNTIGSSHNVASVTKNGTGDFTVNFSQSLTNNLYCAVCNSSQTASYPVTKSSGSVRFGVVNNSGVNTDSTVIDVIVTGGI